jgi:prefoldin subunit 5
LKTYNLPANLVSIGSQAFVRSGITGEVKIPATVTEIGTAAFAATDITSASLPESMKVIPAEIFSGCIKLNSITFSNDVTAIGEKAFYGCESLTSFSFPKALEEIGDKAFGECVGLKEINIPTTVTTLGSQIFIDTSEELVVNVSYDSERPEGWSETWFAGMKGKAMNISEVYYNTVVLANQKGLEDLKKQLEIYQSEFDSINAEMEAINKTKQDLQARYSINPPQYILDMINEYQKEINNLNRLRAEAGSKMVDVKEQIENYSTSAQLN